MIRAYADLYTNVCFAQWFGLVVDNAFYTKPTEKKIKKKKTVHVQIRYEKADFGSLFFVIYLFFRESSNIFNINA